MQDIPRDILARLVVRAPSLRAVCRGMLELHAENQWEIIYQNIECHASGQKTYLTASSHLPHELANADDNRIKLHSLEWCNWWVFIYHYDPVAQFTVDYEAVIKTKFALVDGMMSSPNYKITFKSREGSYEFYSESYGTSQITYKGDGDHRANIDRYIQLIGSKKLAEYLTGGCHDSRCLFEV